MMPQSDIGFIVSSMLNVSQDGKNLANMRVFFIDYNEDKDKYIDINKGQFSPFTIHNLNEILETTHDDHYEDADVVTQYYNEAHCISGRLITPISPCGYSIAAVDENDEVVYEVSIELNIFTKYLKFDMAELSSVLRNRLASIIIDLMKRAESTDSVIYTLKEFEKLDDKIWLYPDYQLSIVHSMNEITYSIELT